MTAGQSDGGVRVPMSSSICDIVPPRMLVKTCDGRKKKKVRDPTSRQHGGILPLLALAIPGYTLAILITAGKAAVLGGVGAVAGYGVKKGLEAATQRQVRC